MNSNFASKLNFRSVYVCSVGSLLRVPYSYLPRRDFSPGLPWSHHAQTTFRRAPPISGENNIRGLFRKKGRWLEKMPVLTVSCTGTKGAPEVNAQRRSLDKSSEGETVGGMCDLGDTRILNKCFRCVSDWWRSNIFCTRNSIDLQRTKYHFQIHFFLDCKVSGANSSHQLIEFCFWCSAELLQ